jgi:hypothetical protein
MQRGHMSRMRKLGTRTATLILAASASVAAFTVGLGPAAATGTTMIRNWNNGRCLDSNSAGAAYTLPCNGGQYQQWEELDEISGAAYTDRLVDVATNRCLTNDSGQVYTYPCIPGYRNQLWVDYDLGGNAHMYLNIQTGFVLKANSAGVVFASEGSANIGDWKRGF